MILVRDIEKILLNQLNDVTDDLSFLKGRINGGARGLSTMERTNEL